MISWLWFGRVFVAVILDLIRNDISNGYFLCLFFINIYVYFFQYNHGETLTERCQLFAFGCENFWFFVLSDEYHFNEEMRLLFISYRYSKIFI